MDELEAYVQKNAKGLSPQEDDLEAYVQKNASPAPKKNSNAGQTALESFANAATLGYLPQLQAGVGALMGLGDYTKLRDENIARQESQSKENPKASLAGNIAGLGASMLLPVGAVTKGASLGQKALSGAKIGAMYGAAANPGDTEGELSPLQLGERTSNALKGAAFGGLIPIAAQGVSKGASKASSFFKGKAEEKAFKALGPYQRDAVKAAAREGQVERVGREILDEGLLSGSPSWKELGKRASEAADKKGSQLDSLVDDIARRADEIDPGSKSLALPGQSARSTSGIDRRAVAKAVRDELVSANTDIPGASKRNDAIKKLVEEFENGGDRFIKVRNNEDLKREISKQINWDRLPNADIPLEEQVLRSLYNKVKTGSEDAAEYLSKSLGDDTAAKFKRAKQSYGNLKQASDIASKRAAKDSANRFLSPSDYGTGIAGAAFGAASGDDLESRLKGAALGMTLAGANKLARTRGNAFVAKNLDSAARGARSASNALTNIKSSPLIPTLANAISKRENIRLEEFEPGLLNLLAENPSLIDSFEDPKIRERLTEQLKKMGRNPSSK